MTLTEALAHPTNTWLNEPVDLEIQFANDLKSGKNGQYRSSKVKDDSGASCYCAFFDGADRAEIHDGAKVRIKGEIKVGDFRGNKNLSCNKVEVVPMSGTPAAQGGGASGGAHAGQSIGMAINQASEFCRSEHGKFVKGYVYETASTLLRISDKLAKGELAPLDHAPPAPQPPPEPEPPAMEEEEDEIPF